MWVVRLSALGAALFFVGWGLVLLSGYGGDSAGGSELLWRTGGIMVYVSIPMLLVAGSLGAISVLRSSARRHCHRA
jgi:hypothetical protein